MFQRTFLLAIVGLAAAWSTSANAARANLICRDQGSYACAQDIRTGQCTHSWSRRDSDNPMYSCRIFTGEVSNVVDRRNYQCSGDSSRACARSLRTGQCTHSWTNGDGMGDAMAQCRRWMGIGQRPIDRSNYQCSAAGADSVCARDIRTGQCTHEWKRKDGGDPWFQCRNWLGR